MSTWWYTVNDPHDKIEQIREVAIKHADIQRSHDVAAEIKRIMWDQRRIVQGHAYFGDPNYQWVAHVPGKVAKLLDLRYPGWCDDEQSLRDTLKKYPECNLVPEDK